LVPWIKVDGNKTYLTMLFFNQIFICNSHNGEVLQKFGIKKFSQKPGEYHFPRGVTFDNKNLYICDYNNHRVQIVSKEKGSFILQWGKQTEGTKKGEFGYPWSIFYDELDREFYIGDTCSVQIFTLEGQCNQRLGDEKTGRNLNQFYLVSCIWRDGNSLYVSEVNNKRIQIFRGS